MGFFYGGHMAAVKKSRAVKSKGEVAARPARRQKQSKEPVTRRSLVEKAYRKVDQELESKEQSDKGIDDLVKLLKVEKDLGGEESDVKEIKVRWEPNEDESSSEG